MIHFLHCGQVCVHTTQRETRRTLRYAKGSPFGGAGALAPERVSSLCAVVQPCGNTPSREKAMLENPQIFQHCKFKNIFPLMMRRATRSAF